MPQVVISEKDLTQWEGALADPWPLAEGDVAAMVGRHTDIDAPAVPITYVQFRALIAAYREREELRSRVDDMENTLMELGERD